jgi:hypothetical protein
MNTQRPLSQPDCTWTEECIEVCTGPSVFVADRGVRATFVNPRRREIRKIHYDSCYSQQVGRQADFIVGLRGTIDVIVELKGSDTNIRGAADQVEDTLNAWQRDLKRAPTLAALIIYGRIEGRKNLQDQLDEITANTRQLVQAADWLSASRPSRSSSTPASRTASCPSARSLPSSPSRMPADAGALGRSACPRPAGHQVLSRPLVFLLRDGARSLARPLRHAARARRTDGCHRPANPAAERLHGRPARASLPRAPRPRQHVAEKFGLVYTVPEYHRTYYLHPRQHSLRQRRARAGGCPSPRLSVIA